MRITVRFFASLREAAGVEACALTLEPGAEGTHAKHALLARFPRLGGLIRVTRLAVNQEYQPWNAKLRDGDELALIPPLSGG